MVATSLGLTAKQISTKETTARAKPIIIDFLLPIFAAIYPTGMNAIALMPIETPEIIDATPVERLSDFVV